MVKYDRINNLVKEHGVKKAAICRKIGKSIYYLRDAEKNKIDIKVEDLQIIASMLQTSTEYLTGETDDPSPIKKDPAAQNGDTPDVLTEQERHFIQMTRQMPPIQRDSLLKFLESSVRNRL